MGAEKKGLRSVGLWAVRFQGKPDIISVFYLFLNHGEYN
jgi:hypothetical protein